MLEAYLCTEDRREFFRTYTADMLYYILSRLCSEELELQPYHAIMHPEKGAAQDTRSAEEIKQSVLARFKK